MSELDKDQIKFIENKVKELGTMEAVKKLYKFWKEKKCLVDRYAVKHAKKISLPEGGESHALENAN